SPGELLRVFKSCDIDHSLRIKHNQVRLRALFDVTIMFETEGLSRKPAHLSHRIFKTQHTEFSHIAPEYSRIRPISARMRLAAKQPIGADVYIRLAHYLLHN